MQCKQTLLSLGNHKITSYFMNRGQKKLPATADAKLFCFKNKQYFISLIDLEGMLKGI